MPFILPRNFLQAKKTARVDQGTVADKQPLAQFAWYDEIKPVFKTLNVSVRSRPQNKLVNTQKRHFVNQSQDFIFNIR